MKMMKIMEVCDYKSIVKVLKKYKVIQTGLCAYIFYRPHQLKAIIEKTKFSPVSCIAVFV